VPENENLNDIDADPKEPDPKAYEPKEPVTFFNFI
jgi:hypothetical protein